MAKKGDRTMTDVAIHVSALSIFGTLVFWYLVSIYAIRRGGGADREEYSTEEKRELFNKVFVAGTILALSFTLIMMSLGFWSGLIGTRYPFPPTGGPDINLAAFIVLTLPAMVYGFIVSCGKGQIIVANEEALIH